MPEVMVESGETDGTTQTWTLPYRLILVINAQGHCDFHNCRVPGAVHCQPRHSLGSHAQTWLLLDATKLSQGQW